MKKKYFLPSLLVIGLLLNILGFLVVPVNAYEIVGDTVIFENQYARLEVTPHTCTDIITQTQYANLTWKYPDNTIDIAFRFEFQLVKKDIWVWKNISHIIKVPEYNVVYYENGTNSTIVNYVETEIYYFDWFNINHLFNKIEYQNKYYYTIMDIDVKQNEVIRIKWSYDIPIKSSGKWDLFAKLSSDSIPTALNSGRYVMIDPWWNSNYENYRMITINHNFVLNDLMNYPLLVILDNTTGDYVFYNGYDIAFVDITNSTQYNHEIELFNNAGKTYCWVNITSISSTVDTQFLVYYNNSDATGLHYNPTNVWDSDYRAVWHMNGSSYGDIYDSTGNGHIPSSATGSIGYQDEGQIGYGIYLPSGNNYLTLSDNDAYSFTDGSNNDQPFTMESWVRYSGATGTASAILGKYSGDADSEWIFPQKLTDDTFRVYLRDRSTGKAIYRYAVDDMLINNESWEYIRLTYDASEVETGINIFINDTYNSGSAGNSGTYEGMENGNNAVLMGHYSTLNWLGYLDEIRISGIVRNESWGNLTFHCTNQTTGLIIIGDENSKPCVEMLLYIVNPTNHSSFYFLSNISIYFISDYAISYSIELSNDLNVSGSTTNNTVVYLNFTYYLVYKNYTFYVNATNGCNIVNQSFNFSILNANSSISGGGFLSGTLVIDSDQFTILLTLTLFIFFFSIGYKENKRSGGALMILSGFCLLSFEALTVLILSSFFILPLLTPISIFILLLGVRKWLYPFEGEKTKSEGQ